MPPSSKKPPAAQSEPVEDTDPGAPVDMLKTGTMQRLPRTRKDFPAPDEAGEPTLVYDQNKGGHTEGVGAPKLIITAGPRAGNHVELTQAESTIGRGGDNAVVIPDLSVSRHHAVIRREPRGYVVLDQGSGNGTRVNGMAVGRHELQSGDIIDLGDSSMQFVEAGGVTVKGARRSPPGQSLPPRPGVRGGASLGAGKPELTNPRATGLQRRTPIYLVIAVVLLALLSVGLLRKRQREQAATTAAEHTTGSKAVAQKRFAEAVELVKQAKWADARDKLVIAASLDETDEEIRRYLDRAKVEAPRSRAVADAQAALSRRDYKAAREALAAVPDDSALAGAATELLHSIRLQMDLAVRDAKAKADTGDPATAEALVAPVLEAEPNRRDALAVRDALEASRRRPPARRPEAEAAGEKRARAARAEKREAAPVLPPAVAPIVDLYLSGDVRSAIARAESAGAADSSAARLARQLRELDRSYREGLAHAEGRKPGEAIRALQSASELDRAVARGRDSRPGVEIRRALGKVHYSVGAASLASDDGLPGAAQHLRAAVAADPANDLARQQLEQVRARARELYLRGYVAKDSDAETARAQFKLVVEILPEGDATREKARRWLDRLDGRVPKDD
jgi:pSer/pThr/pTyr-binding forkhead associated (FHA) protein